MLHFLEEMFYKAFNTEHIQSALAFMCIYFLNYIIGFVRRIVHVCKYEKTGRCWKFLLTPFNQIFTFAILPWGNILNLVRNKPAVLSKSKEVENQISHDVKF